MRFSLVVGAIVGTGLVAACGPRKTAAVPQPFPRPAAASSAQPSSSASSAPAGTRPAAEAISKQPLPGATLVPPVAEAVVSNARAQMGIKYVLGGETPGTGFDCSGLVRFVFLAESIDLPRVVSDQFDRGVKVSIQEVQAGDLIFFSTTGPGATHVGIVSGPGTFIHAPSSTGVVREEHYDNAYWHPRIVGARRILR